MCVSIAISENDSHKIKIWEYLSSIKQHLIKKFLNMRKYSE